MTAKEKLYRKIIAMVEKAIADGKSITAARYEVSGKSGVSYPKVVDLTKHLSLQVVKRSRADNQ